VLKVQEEEQEEQEQEEHNWHVIGKDLMRLSLLLHRIQRTESISSYSTTRAG